jgi:hypothetical protein
LRGAAASFDEGFYLVGSPQSYLPIHRMADPRVLNFEVKDLRPPEGARLWRVLEFKVRMRFSAAARTMDFPAQRAPACLATKPMRFKAAVSRLPP